jgi:hypothetical protein
VRDITIYHLKTGRIDCVTSAEPGAERLVPGYGFVEGRVDGTFHRIEGGAAVPLARFAVTVDGNRITGIPAGTMAQVEGQTVKVSRGRLDIAVDWPQAVRVSLFHPDYQFDNQAEFHVDCVPGDKVPAGAVRIAQDVTLLRRDAYPPITDFIDAWVKDDSAALEDYRQDCLAVKARFPKKGRR